MTAPSAEPPPFVVGPADPRSPDAEALLRRLTYELAERYDFEYDGSGDFSADDVGVPGSAFLIGRAGGEPAACGAYKPMSPGVAEVKRVFVAPEHRGRGYARRLLAELERRAAAEGYSRLRLETGDRQAESIALYESAGFRRVPNFEPYVGSGWSVCFEKAIGTADVWPHR